MISTGHIYLNKKNIRHTFNTKVAVINVLIAVTFCLFYLLSKYCYSVDSTIYFTINIKHTKHK
jgi:hypothetical protein